MHDLLYFPGFEVKDESWLKFALLYIDEIRPIIPEIGLHKEEYFSEKSLRIMSETEFIRPYKPDSNESICASAIACEEFDKYLMHPDLYSKIFNHHGIDNRIDVKWKNPMFHNYILFEGKYTNQFFNYCLENRLATPCHEGIRISNDLAFVYMSFLADIISKNNGLEMITDYQKYNTILLKNDQQLLKNSKQQIEIAKNNIEFNVPSNLRNIPLEVFIEFRKNRDFNECRKAYSKEIQKLIKAKESIQPDYSLEELLSYQKDFIKICQYSFDMIAAVTLTIYSALSIKNAESVTFDIASAISATYCEYRALHDIVYEMPKFLSGLKDKYLARKYVADLKRLVKN